MLSMFDGCSGLTSLNLSNFDTANVIDMSSMFSNCSSLTSLDLSNFDTANVTNMSYMFSSMAGNNNKTIDISNFNMSSVTDSSYMFSSSLKHDSSFVTTTSYNGISTLKLPVLNMQDKSTNNNFFGTATIYGTDIATATIVVKNSTDSAWVREKINIAYQSGSGTINIA
jgi:surface protein